MKIKTLCTLLVGGAIAVTLAGCCCGGGSDETVIVEKQPVSTTPVGEELIKLKEALDKGAITQKEYDAAKQNLLKQ